MRRDWAFNVHCTKAIPSEEDAVADPFALALVSSFRFPPIASVEDVREGVGLNVQSCCLLSTCAAAGELQPELVNDSRIDCEASGDMKLYMQEKTS